MERPRVDAGSICLGAFAAFAGCGVAVGAFGLFIAGEGIGPGDSLSMVGWAVPVVVGGAVAWAIVRRHRGRLIGACAFFAALLLYWWTPYLWSGRSLDADLVPFSLAIAGMLVPSLLAQWLGITQARSAD